MEFKVQQYKELLHCFSFFSSIFPNYEIFMREADLLKTPSKNSISNYNYWILKNMEIIF